MRGVTIMKKELLKGLTEEQIKKVEACKNAEEILALAKAEGVQLSEEQLAAVSGGGCGSTADPVKCNQCGSLNCEKYGKTKNLWTNEWNYKWRCNDCGNKWVWE